MVTNLSDDDVGAIFFDHEAVALVHDQIRVRSQKALIADDSAQRFDDGEQCGRDQSGRTSTGVRPMSANRRQTLIIVPNRRETRSAEGQGLGAVFAES